MMPIDAKSEDLSNDISNIHVGFNVRELQASLRSAISLAKLIGPLPPMPGDYLALTYFQKLRFW